ncbi:MAG: isoleucyl-tRNA synthetase, partial [Gammaproteobacteria bacterium]|nr:isoleucyl-tRNA synthetase [Gammaproteobacteria bacterium]
LYLEGSDQHRGWFQSSLLTSVGINRIAPYKGVLTHGFTIDAEGRKMSKSLGNTIEPQQVTKTLGADILRLWVAATDYRAEMSLSDEILKRMTDAYRKIRNTARYLLANLDGFDPQRDGVATADLLDLDRWVLEHTGVLQREIISAYTSYQFHLIYQKLHHFCVVTLSGFYLDILKDRMYTMRKQSHARRSAQTVMYHVVEALVRWLAPILSFTAEEIWQYIPGRRGSSVFCEDWYTGVEIEPDPRRDEHWQHIITVRDAVSKQLEQLRVAGAIGSSLDAEVDIYCDGALQDSLLRLADELHFVCITSYANVRSVREKAEAAVPGGLDGLWVLAQASAHGKCIRCWHHREDVGSNTDHPELCSRCLTNVAGVGEARKYA